MEAVNSRARRFAPGLRRRRPDATRRRILMAATSEFAAKGLAGARVDKIAARARVSKRMLYHYFGDKEALWLAVLEQAYLNIRSEERELDVSHLLPIAGMRRLIEFTIAYVASHPEFISLLLSENLHRAQYLRRSRKVRELHTSLLGAIADLLRRGQRAGVFRKHVVIEAFALRVSSVSALCKRLAESSRMVAALASPFLRTGAASLYRQPRPRKAVGGDPRWRRGYEPAR